VTTPIRPLVLVDLDDTLFQTIGKCPPGFAESELVIAATATTGKHSFMTPAQKAMIDWLLATTDMVPVTARSSGAYKGVNIAFTAGAILSNGSLILNADGSIDSEWQAIINGDLAGYRSVLKDLLAAGRQSAERQGLDVRSLTVGENGVLSYVVFKDNEGDGRRLAEIEFDRQAIAGWTRHHNGNNLALIPPVLSKKRAAAYLIGKIRQSRPNVPVLGLGDSVSDIPFLQLCDWWGMPARSQIAQIFELAEAAE
jgi:hypothetical protein